jgi:tetratricopeptide (TPR) repeat protein
VPYGYNVQGFGAGNRAPWRAGANENTTITFSNDAKVQGQPVPAGEYGLFFVINKDNAGEVILSKDYKSWGSFWYDSTHDFMRAPIQLRDIPMTEMLTYNFINDDKNSAELVLNWEKKQFPVKIEFDVDKIVMDNAKEQLKNTVGFSWQGYASAANYALQNNTNLDEAVVWANQAIAQNRNFTTMNLKSNLLKAQGNADEAAKTMDTAIQLSTENELNLYAYGLLNQKQTDKAIEMFLLNTKRHPESANVWDSLGEGYFNKGDKKNAIASFKKSLSMNPPPLVRANSEKFLKQMGAM